MAVTTALVVGTVASAAISANAAKKGAKAQQRGYDNATAEQARQYDQTREDLSQYREIGGNALGRLDRTSTGDMTNFFASPDYNFRREEGMRGLERTAAARGGAFSGNALRALGERNSNLASGEFGDWWNRQAGLAGIGQSATNATAMAGQNKANNVSNNMIGAGDARASGIAGQANAWSGAISGLTNYGMYNGFGGGGGGGQNQFAMNYRPRYGGYA